MKIIFTKSFLKTLSKTLSKTAGNWDDQQNFCEPRDQKQQGQYLYTGNSVDNAPDNVEQIEEQWGKGKKKSRKKKNIVPRRWWQKEWPDVSMM